MNQLELYAAIRSLPQIAHVVTLGILVIAVVYTIAIIRIYLK